MDREHKEFVIRSVYGIIQTTGEYLKKSSEKRFFDRFGFHPDKIEVTQSDKYMEGEEGRSVWVGGMEMILTVNGESYSVYRDWLDEYIVDRRHPNYNDDYFYDSDECYSQKRYKQLMEGIR